MEEGQSPIPLSNPVLEQFRCRGCNSRLFDFKLLGGAIILECKCPKCGHMNVLKMGVAVAGRQIDTRKS